MADPLKSYCAHYHHPPVSAATMAGTCLSRSSILWLSAIQGEVIWASTPADSMQSSSEEVRAHSRPSITSRPPHCNAKSGACTGYSDNAFTDVFAYNDTACNHILATARFRADPEEHYMTLWPRPEGVTIGGHICTL